MRIGKFFLERLAGFLNWFGIAARLPPEYMFLKDFYLSQVLSDEKLAQSSFVDPAPEENIYTRLPSLVVYYLTRWEYLNLITRFKNEFLQIPWRKIFSITLKNYYGVSTRIQ